MVFGGNLPNEVSAIEVLSGDLGTKLLALLPKGIKGPSIFLQNGAILISGFISFKSQFPNRCIQLDTPPILKTHSHLIEPRHRGHSAVTTKTATFLFGGWDSRTTYEYLPKDSTEWIMGRTEIPNGGLNHGCAIAVKSEQEIWLIGGDSTRQKILSFSVKDHTFQELPLSLKQDKAWTKCANIPNTNKIMIMSKYSTSMELLDTEKGSVITLAATPNSSRYCFGLGVVTITDEDRLAVFGGHNWVEELDSVELYNTQTEEWETTDIKWQEPKAGFSSLTVKIGDIISDIE